MDRLLTFSEGHEIYRKSFRSWLEKEVVPFHDQWEKDRRVPRHIWTQAGELGFLCPTIPEEYGGAGGDFLHSVVLAEEIERVHATGLGGIPLHNDIIAPYIREHGTEEQKLKYLPRCASGELILAVAMTEPNAGSDLAAIQATAIADGDEYVINGQKTFISNGQCCDLIVVVAKTDPKAQPAHAGISLLLVEATNPGFKRGRNLEKVGLHAQDTSEMFFEGCRVPKSALLGGVEGKGFYQLMHELQQERLITAVGSQAAAEFALAQALQYSCERRAFGKRIADFQHHAFKIAEMATQVELGRCFVDRLVVEHMQGKPLLKEVSMAKYWVTDMLHKVVDDGVQLHGGYGYMLEYPIGKMYQDCRVQRIFAGSNEIMKLIISRQLIGRG
ncbi:MAG: acyl-CoA dehydrogenase family protein [Deltaproteobacteria bacterium]|nr:acyl-CoA dehydrogenase family protein [Deltaproteobacteria bacterium]